MCIIIYSPDGHIPKSHLERSLEHNSDGWGVMVWDGKQALVEKGMKPAAFWAKWALRPKGPVVFHAPPGKIELARQAGIMNVTQVAADDGGGKGLALYQVDLSK